MKFLVLITLILVGCDKAVLPEITKDTAEENLRYKAGPKYHGGCFKVSDRKSPYFGCTFVSTQGSMFVRDLGKTEDLSWHVIANRKIRCLFVSPFVKETSVKKIKCPESAYR